MINARERRERAAHRGDSDIVFFIFEVTSFFTTGIKDREKY
jgi:hypothetical protein